MSNKENEKGGMKGYYYWKVENIEKIQI